jgi:MFS family permease
VILSVLVIGGGAFSLIQSLVAPALGTIQRELDITAIGAAWIFIVSLVSTSVVTPLVGRLGDMFGQKRVLLLSLLTLALGSLVCALADSLAPLLVGRALQGAGGGVFAAGYGIIRDQFPAPHVRFGVGVLSSSLGVGGALGIVLAGPIADNLSYHWLFWIPLFTAAATAAAAALLVPESRVRAPGRIDWWGAALFFGWLCALLVAVCKAPAWGWAAPETLGLVVGGVAAAGAWIALESRTLEPLIEMRMMRLRGVWTANAAAFALGFGVFSSFVMVPQLVQNPAATGAGFDASVSEAAFFLLPASVLLLALGPLAGRIADVVGARLSLLAGALVCSAAFALLAFANDERWHVYLASALIGVGMALAYGSMAMIVVEAVPAGQTGVASGMNLIMRTVGGAAGTAVAASIVAADAGAAGFPGEASFKATFLIFVGGAVCAALAALAVPRPRRAALD